MSRSKHTDPKAIRAARRVRAPRASRDSGDLSRRRGLGRVPKQTGDERAEERVEPGGRVPVRIIVRKARPGFHHPASKQDVLELLTAIGPVGIYGLRSVELVQSTANGSPSVLLFGRHGVPGRIILFEQPVPPWRFSGLLKGDVVRRLERAGAALTWLTEIGATLVDWPEDTLRRFMLEEVLLHELGHHVLQHYKGKRPVRIARTRDHEAFAARFAEKQRAALMKGSCS